VPRKARKKLHTLWCEEVARKGITVPIPMEISKRGHNIGKGVPLSKVLATYHISRDFVSPHARVVIHPRVLDLDDHYQRKVMRNELNDIVRRSKTRPWLKRALKRLGRK